jgi:hypothetical protein
MGNLTKMRSISTAMTSLRNNLKEQEKRNLVYRKKITNLWSDKKKEDEIAALSNMLSIGRAKVRATQTELHTLKHRLRYHNQRYDLSKAEK